MKRFGVFDSSGRLLRVGVCHDDTVSAQAGTGETAREGEFSFSREARQDSYRARRAQEYPPIGDQLDAIIKTIAASGAELPPEMKTLLQAVADVKARHPKG